MDEQEQLAKEKEEKQRPRYREFTVAPGMCGFKVKIGCSEAYFSNPGDVQRAINDYLNDPIGKEKQILSGDIRFGASMPGGLVRDCAPVPTLNAEEVRTVRAAIQQSAGMATEGRALNEAACKRSR